MLRQCKAQNLSTASAKRAVQSVLATYACTLVRQALHDCTNVAIVCNVGNPSRVENVSIVDFHKFSFAFCSRPPAMLDFFFAHCRLPLTYCRLHVLALQHRTVSVTETVTSTSSFLHFRGKVAPRVRVKVGMHDAVF